MRKEQICLCLEWKSNWKKKQYYMAYIIYNKLWQSKFYNSVSTKDRVQDINLNQLNLKVNDTYKKDQKITNFEPSDDSDVLNKAYLDTKISKIECNVSFL